MPITSLSQSNGVVSLSIQDLSSGLPQFEFLGGPSGHFETASIGNDANFGSWILPDDGSDAIKQVVDDGERGQCWYADQSPGLYNASARFDWGSTIPEDTYIYVSWMTKRVLNAGGGGQWKKLRISNTNNITDHEPELVYFHWDNSGSNLAAHTSSGITYYADTSQTDGQWYREEWIYKTSDQGVKDGYHQHYLHDGQNPPALVDWRYSGDTAPLYPNLYTYEDAERFRWFLFQNYRGNGNTDQEIWMDDHYVQVGSVKRIEIGDNPVFADCAHREIQRPLSWTTSDIDFELNLGSFNSTDGLYAFVITDSGVSDGFAFDPAPTDTSTSMHRFYILDNELRSDPLGRGYSSMTDQEICDSLNATDRDADDLNSLISTDIFDAIDRDEYAALADALKEQVKIILSLGTVNVGPGSKARDTLITAFGAGTNTRAELLALITNQLQPRWEEINLPKPCKVGWVEDVIREGGPL